MSLLLAVARAEQQRQHHRPLDHVLHTLLAAIQHATATDGVWLAEVVPDDTGAPQLRHRASTGCLQQARLGLDRPPVQQALFGTAAPLSLDGCEALLLPVGTDGETQAVLALAGPGPFDRTQPVARDVDAVGTVISAWIEEERSARAERRAWRRLEANAARYRALFHDALDAMLLVDDQGRVVEANRAADRMLGGGFGQRLTEWLDVPEPPPLGRHTVLLHDGTPVDAAVSPVATPHGSLRAVVLRDTEDQRRAADALQDLNHQLQQRVDELGRLSRENELLGELGAFLQASQSAAEVHAVVRRFAAALFGGHGALYALNDGELEQSAAWGDGALPVRLDAASCWALRRGELHLCHGADGLGCEHHRAHPGTTACMPVMSAHGPVALLHAVLPPDAGRAPRVERLLRAVADRLGAALTTLALQQRLRQESIRDPLTRLYNRRYMVETMERELARTRRAGEPLAVIMLDVDHFKRLNDTHGHDVGDRVLQEVARRLAGVVRAEDVVCRYGGEEFVVILPGASVELARARAEAFRAELAVGLAGRGGRLPTVTVSAGVALAREGIGPDRLLRTADEALLQAKRAGRDRVVLAPSAEATPALRVAQST